MKLNLMVLAVSLVAVDSLAGIDVAATDADSRQSRPSALVSGQVIDADTRQPLTGAMVWIQPLKGEPRSRIGVLVDERGRFAFDKLAAGSYILRASREGFMTASYGQRSATTRDYVTLDVAQERAHRDIVLPLWKYAFVTGRVVDDSGQPVAGVSIRGMRRTVIAGNTTFTFDSVECSGACLLTQTDDRGMFSFNKIVPGAYVFVVPSVVVSLPTALLPRSTDRGFDFLSSIFLRSSTPAMQWVGGWETALRSGLETADGRIVVRSADNSSAIAALSQNGEIAVYPSAYYPSVTRADSAAVIPLEAGSRRDDIVIVRRPSASVRVSGRAVMAEGPAEALVLRLVPSDQEELALDLESAVAVTDKTGQFSFAGVVPGAYRIKALLKPTTEARSSGTAIPTPVLWIDEPLSVGAAGVDGIELSLKRAPTISGQLEYSGQSPRSPRAPAIHLERADGRRPTALGLILTTISSGTSFASPGVLPGTYVVDVDYREPGWFAHSVMWHGKDISDSAFEVADSDLAGIVIRIVDRPWTILSGSVQRNAGTSEGRPTVALFPVEEARWSNLGPNPRRVQEVVADLNGTFTIANVPPGDYFVVAFESAPGSPWQAPDSLKQLAGLASKVTLSDGVTSTVALRAVRWPR